MSKLCTNCIHIAEDEDGPHCDSCNNFSNYEEKPKQLFTPQDLLQASAVIYAGLLSDPNITEVDTATCYANAKKLAKLIEDDFKEGSK